MKRTSSGKIPVASSRLSGGGGPLRVRSSSEENRRSAGGKQRSSLGQTRSSFGQGRQSFGTLRTSFGGRPVKRAVSTSSASSRGTPGKGRDSVALHRPRRSSGLGHSSSQPLKDPRNLKNEQFKRAAIEKLLQFLSDNEFDGAISYRALNPPQTKDFKKVFEFLVSMLDPHYQLLDKKVEDEVPAVLKKLRYPFNIPKQYMFSIGASHAWPAMLGALDWMRELIVKNSQNPVTGLLFQKDETDFDSDKSRQELVWEYLRVAYDLFMHGQDDFHDLEQKLCKDLSGSGVSEQLSQAEKENSLLRETLETLEQSADPLVKTQNEIDECALDIEKLQSYIAKLEDHAKKRQQSLTAAEQEVDETKARLDVLEQDVARKRQIYQTQELTQADVERINREKLQLRGEADRLRAEKTEQEKQIGKVEMDITREQEKCGDSISKYNRMAHLHKLLPLTAENACGLDLELKTTTHWHNADVFADVMPALQELRSKWRSRVHETTEQLSRSKEALEQVTDMVLEKESEGSKLRNKTQRLEEEIQSVKEINAREMARLEEQVEQTRSNCENSKRDAQRCKGRLEDAKKNLADTKAHCTEKDQRRKEELNGFKQLCVRAIEAVVAHKEKMQENSEEFRRYITAVCEREERVAQGKSVPEVIPPWEENLSGS